MAFPYRLSVQQKLTHLPAQVTLVAATGKAANDLHLTFTRHLQIQSQRVTYLMSAEVADRVTQGHFFRILGLSNEAYALDHTKWQTASEDTIAQIRTDGPQGQRRQEPFAALPHCNKRTPSTVTLNLFPSKEWQPSSQLPLRLHLTMNPSA